MRKYLGIALIFAVGGSLLTGCSKSDETTTAPPPVTKEARPDPPNPNKVQNMPKAEGQDKAL
jgi:major membrane immunogen (membrane-anchored lipoprotein)